MFASITKYNFPRRRANVGPLMELYYEDHEKKYTQTPSRNSHVETA